MPEKKENMNITSIQLLIQREQGFGGQGCRIGDTGGGGGVTVAKSFFWHQNHCYTFLTRCFNGK